MNTKREINEYRHIRLVSLANFWTFNTGHIRIFRDATPDIYINLGVQNQDISFKLLKNITETLNVIYSVLFCAIHDTFHKRFILATT